MTDTHIISTCILDPFPIMRIKELSLTRSTQLWLCDVSLHIRGRKARPQMINHCSVHDPMTTSDLSTSFSSAQKLGRTPTESATLARWGAI